MWGPAYRGVFGTFKKGVELVKKPHYLPFVAGWICMASLLTSFPATEEQVLGSMLTNRDAILEERKKKTGHYYH